MSLPVNGADTTSPAPATSGGGSDLPEVDPNAPPPSTFFEALPGYDQASTCCSIMHLLLFPL